MPVLSDGRRVRLHHRRRGLGRLRAGQPAVRRSVQARAAAGSGRRRQLDLVSHSGRLSVRHRQSAFGLDAEDGSPAGPQRAGPQLSARQGGRRLLRHQRHGLHARAGRRLRPLAPARAARLVVGRRAAVFQEARGPFPRRQRASRDRRRMAHRTSAHALGHHRRLARGGGAIRHSAQQRLQHRRQRRHLLFPRQPEARAALVGGARISQTGAQPAEPAAGNRLPGRGPCLYRQARHRRAFPAGGRFARRALPRRGHPGGRLDRLAADHDAVGRRPRRRSRRNTASRSCSTSPASAPTCTTICNCG